MNPVNSPRSRLKQVNVFLSTLIRWSNQGADFSIRTASKLFWPKIELAIRLWLAQLYLVSGVLKLTHWQTALDLATNEYPVSWMNPHSAAVVGVIIEVLGGLLLGAGLMTRYAALPMLILALVAQFSYLPFDNQLFWAVLLGWYVIEGAGPLSLDSLMRRGLSDSALPLVPRIVKLSAWVRDNLGPYYVSIMRIWLACSLLLSRATLHPVVATLMPVNTAIYLPAKLAILGGVLLLIGLGTRYISAILVVALFIGSMIDPRSTDAVYLLMMYAIFINFGGGALSIDKIFVALIRNFLPHWLEKQSISITESTPRIVIVGAGFGGISCAKALQGTHASITLIDRANYHLFQPLLYQVATAGLSPSDIATPIRSQFRDASNVRVMLGTVSGVDTAQQQVLMDGKSIPYDYLVLATGAAHSYFGKDQWAPFAPGLKRVEDATEVRRKILTAFERAEVTDDANERDALLTFLVVGGGPTGVELAGAIVELARHGMDKEFRNFDPASARVVLVQSAPRVLPTFPEKLSAIAKQSLEALGVEVLTGSRVENINAEGVTVSGKHIPSRTVLWAAGVAASPAAKWLQAEADNAGRVKVGDELLVTGLLNVYAIGDTALSNAWKGQPVPGLAPAAKQGGHYVAKHIRARIEGRALPSRFKYQHLGSLATIGRKSAVADFSIFKLWGAPAWWLWGVIHVSFLVGVRNRAATMINWFWSYLTYGGGIRLITGTDAKLANAMNHQPAEAVKTGT